MPYALGGEINRRGSYSTRMDPRRICIPSESGTRGVTTTHVWNLENHAVRRAFQWFYTKQCKENSCIVL